MKIVHAVLLMFVATALLGVGLFAQAAHEPKPSAPAIIVVDKDQVKDLTIIRQQEEITLHKYQELYLKWQQGADVQQIMHENAQLEQQNQQLTKAIYDKAKVGPQAYVLDLSKGALIPSQPPAPSQEAPKPPEAPKK